MRRTNTVIFTKDISRIFVYIALIQPTAGPRSSGTPFLVFLLIYFARKKIILHCFIRIPESNKTNQHLKCFFADIFG